MKKKINLRSILLIVIGVIVLAGAALLIWRMNFSQPNSSPAKTPIPSPTQAIPSPTQSSQYYYPISNYATRKTLKWYGKKVTAADTKAEMCGADFTGYHIGDDLEILPRELNIDVPVYSIADGVVREAQHVNGYGGLIVIEYNLSGQVVTAYYGHINLASTQVKAGDHVKAGQKIANLGAACSSQADGERKHLHFAIHQGTGIDVRGYVAAQSELRAWLNPSDILQQLKSQNPTG